MGFAHQTKPEDWPIMKPERLDFEVSPEHFFLQNPAYETAFPCVIPPIFNTPKEN